MMNTPEPLGELNPLPDSHLFTVRVWPEFLGPGRVEWRGKAQHVLSGEARYFREWEDLIAFVKQLTQPKQEDIP
jgi:hypothetical protein